MTSIAEKTHNTYTRTILLPDQCEQELQELLKQEDTCYQVGVSVARTLSKQENNNALVSTLLNREYDKKEIKEIPARIIKPSLHVQQSASIRRIIEELKLDENNNEDQIRRKLRAIDLRKQTIEYLITTQDDWAKVGKQILRGSINYSKQNEQQRPFKEYKAIVKELSR